MRPQPNTAEPIASLLPILDAFNHRHHNQHRASHWWSGFRLLRRCARGLVDDSNALTGKSKAALAVLDRRARWAHTHVVPRCYILFSQLAADNQHAPLGLLLLTTLARLKTVLSAILPPEISHTDQAPVAALHTNNRAPERHTEDQGTDRGTVVSRAQIEHRSVSAKPKKMRRSASPPKEDSAPAAPVGIKKHKLKDKDKPTDKKRKKQGSKKSGDEFSSLFGSLS